MSAVEVATAGEDDTAAFAGALARSLAPGAVLALVGDLGAGKTTFVRGFVHGLPGGAALRVQSPTFALARTYPCAPPVHHLDLYRLDDEGACYDLGLADLVQDEAALSCVEWADRAPGILRGLDVVWVRFPAHAASARTLAVEAAAPKRAAVMQALGDFEGLRTQKR